MTLTLLVAMDENRVIGQGGKMPWHLSADLKRFKQTTLGHTIVMGRRTYESIGRPLPGRRMIVVTRQTNYCPSPEVRVVHSLDQALQFAKSPPAYADGSPMSGEANEVFIVGGGEIYRQALPRADRLLITRIHAQFDGDTFFPEFDRNHWQLTNTEHHAATEKNPLAFTFEEYRRR